MLGSMLPASFFQVVGNKRYLFGDVETTTGRPFARS